MELNCEVCIVGSGVIGLSIAYQLAVSDPGQEKKIVVMDATLPGAASWAGAGILPPPTKQSTHDPLERLQQLSLQMMPKWSSDLLQLTGIDNQYQACGGFYLAKSAGEFAALIGLKGFWEDVGIEFRTRTVDQLQTLEPWVAGQLKADDYRLIAEIPGETQLRNPRHLLALRAACQLLGVQFFAMTQDQANDLQLSDDRRVLEVGRGARVRCNQVVVAAGSWTSRILQRWLGNKEPVVSVFPVKGEMLLFKTPQPMFRSVINVGTRYFVPRLDGHVLVGSTEDEVGFATQATQAAKSDLLALVDDVLPDLRQFPLLQHWVGFRPASFDQTPTIGRVKSCPNMVVATGHFRSGIQWSIGTAICVAAILRSETPPLDLRVFQPGR